MILAIPNRGKVTGRVTNINKIANVIAELEVLDSSDVGNFPNFVKRHMGKKISVTIKEESKLWNDLRVGQKVELIVEYIGDEHGGLFKEILI